MIKIDIENNKNWNQIKETHSLYLKKAILAELSNLDIINDDYVKRRKIRTQNSYKTDVVAI